MKNYLAKAQAKLKNSKGFTMIELIIVIAIIVILAAIAVPTFASFITSAHETSAISDARNIYLSAKVAALNAEIATGDALGTTDYTTDLDLLEFAAKDANIDVNDENSSTAKLEDDGTSANIESGEIDFTYTSVNGVVVTCDNGTFTAN